MADRVLRFKEGASLIGLQPEALYGIDVCLDVFHQNKLPMTITSARDGKHSRYSHHYKGLAWDIRIWDIEKEIDLYCEAIREGLGPEYQVFNEKDHIHCEYDPAQEAI